MADQTIIALDAGRSAFKVIAYAQGVLQEFTIPSLVTPWEQISDDGQAASAENETVEVYGHRYFCGDSARLHSGATMTVGLSDEWHDSTEYRALCLAAIKKLSLRGVPGLVDPLIIVGTPAKLYQAHRFKHQEITSQTINGTVKALSQPMGAYLSYLMDDRGLPIRDRMYREDGSKRSYGIIEIGHYTSDFILIREGAPIDTSFKTCEGMHMASDKLMQILTNKGFSNQTPVKCTTSLMTRTSRLREQNVHIGAEVTEAAKYVADRIVRTAVNTFSSERDELDGLLIAGGGAPLIFSHLKDVLHNVVLLDDPRMSVAKGYLKYGKGILRRQTSSQKLMVEANG